MTSFSGYTIGLLSAAAIHLALLFGIQPREQMTPPEFGIEALPPGVEVTLVAALPAPEAEIPPETPEPPTPDIEEPAPELTPPPEPPPDVAPELSPDITPASEPAAVPAPAPPAPPAPTRVSPPPRPKQQPRPAHPRSASPVSGDGSSPIPGHDATSAHASSGGFSARPGYLRNPHPAYPEEARRAGHQGVVYLAVKVDERGRVTGATVARSSGHPALDERALSTVRERWIFKPARQGNRPVAAEVMIPVRFTLENR